jgi:hypothetical protein
MIADPHSAMINEKPAAPAAAASLRSQQAPQAVPPRQGERVRFDLGGEGHDVECGNQLVERREGPPACRGLQCSFARQALDRRATLDARQNAIARGTP